MSDSIRLADHIWNDGGSLVDRLEHLSHGNAPASALYNEATSGFLAVSGGVASSLVLSHGDSGESQILARSGIDLSQPTAPPDAGTSPIGRNVLASWLGPLQLVSKTTLDTFTTIQLSIRFEQPTEAKASQALCELAEAVLKIVTTTYLREQYRDLRSIFHAIENREHWINRMHSGTTLHESFAIVAESVAHITKAGRVCLLKRKGSSYQLIASSTQPVIDRRAQQVRLLETFVSDVLFDQSSFRFTAGAPAQSSGAATTSMDRYLESAGSRSLHLETISKCSDNPNVIAAILLENYHAEDVDTDRSYQLIETSCTDAVRSAIARDDMNWAHFGWKGIVQSLASVSSQRKILLTVCTILTTSCLLWLIPSELKLAVDGRVIAKTQQRIFAPSDASIVDVLVENGQTVQLGDPLVQLRSTKLDLLLQQIEGDLSTTRTQLSVAAAKRSSAGRGNGQGTGTFSGFSLSDDAADEKVLTARIDGLNKQLQIVRDQRNELNIVSPIDGRVDFWDMEQSLATRPVTHGEYLLDVIAPNDGWTIELHIPEHESAYVIDQQKISPCRCVFRLRSAAESEFESTLDQVASVAWLSEQGRPIVPASLTIPLKSSDDGTTVVPSVRSGATVKAWVYCGKRSLGFVWFRSVIQWARQRGWF